MSDPIRIMSAPTDQGGCGWYRVRQPFEMIRRLTPHDTYIIDKDDDMVEVLKAIKNTHVMVMRPGAEPFMGEVAQHKDFKHLKWVLDIDDNVELISPYNKHYDEYGVNEFYDRNMKKWLWKDGVANFDIKANQLRVDRHLTGLRGADMVTVSTESLAEYARNYNDNVVVLPNMINEERWWKPNFKKHKGVRVGWAGGISHYEDWFSIKEPLNQLMREHQFTLVMVGTNFEGIIDKDNRHLLELHDWVPFKGHSYRMMMMDLDFAIIPLADLPFNRYKSSIKWYEFSAMAVPCVVANLTPYSEDFEDGVTARGYTTAGDFKKAVYDLLQSVHQRSYIGENAQKWVKKHRIAQKNAQLWVDAYANLLKE